MNDDDLIGRPPPRELYVPSGRVLAATAATLAKTVDVLRTVPGAEAACVWLGSLDDRGDGRAYAVVVPRQKNSRGNYHVTADATLEVAQVARAHGWTIVGAIHSHPGTSVEHSRYDDAMTPSRRAVSIVFPRYGHWNDVWPRGLGVHEFLRDYWHLLSARDAVARVKLLEGPSAPVLDLR